MVVVLIAFFGFTLGRSTGDGILPAERSVKKDYPLPPPPPESSSEPAETTEVEDRNIILEVPVDGAAVQFSFKVAGRADMNQDGIVIRVSNSEGDLLDEIEAELSPTGGGYGRFSETIYLKDAEEGSGVSVVVSGMNAEGEVTETVERDLIVMTEDMISVDVYFPNSDLDPWADPCLAVYPLERRVSSNTAIYRSVIEELIAGPTDDEEKDGYGTSLPPYAVLKDIAADADGVVTANFSRSLERGVAGSCRVGSIRIQITETLKQFPEVREVIVSIDGRTEDVLQP